MLFRVFTVLSFVALFISIWILTSPARRPHAQTEAGQSELPGYYFKHAVLTEYDITGNPSIRIHAERIDQIDHGNEVALYNVRVDYQTPDSQAWVLFGDTAHVEPGGKIIDVHGNVRLEGESSSSAAAAVIRADTLTYNVPDSVATTKSDVRIDYAGHTLTARGLIANLKERTMRLESKVNGRFHP